MSLTCQRCRGQVIPPICASVSLSATLMASDPVLPGADTSLRVACSVCRRYFLDHITSLHVTFCVEATTQPLCLGHFHWPVGDLLLWLLSASVSSWWLFDISPLALVCSLGKWLVPGLVHVSSLPVWEP